MDKILIVKLGAIGDVVLALPAMATIRTEHPKHHITLLIGQASAPLLEGHPAIDNVLAIDEEIFWRKKIISLLRLTWKLRQEQFQKVYILHWSTLFHRFFQLLGIPERWGFAREGSAPLLTHKVPYVEGSPDAHEVSQYLSAVSDRYKVSAQAELQPKLFLSQAETANAQHLTSPHEIPIAFAPGGGRNAKLEMPQKRWLSERFIELAEQLIATQKATVFVVGDAAEASLLKPLSDKYPNQVKLLAGQTTLRQAAALIQHCRVFIGNDSGLFHIAGAVGTPSVVFFGPTSPHGKMPLWLPFRLLYSQEACSPCYKHGYAPPCPYQLQCMEHLSVESAYHAVVDLLKATS